MRNLSTTVAPMIRKAVAEAEAAKQAETQMLADSLGNLNLSRLTEEDVKRMGLKKGGYVRTADGCAKRGKTRGKIV
jgi:hypothetical protein